MDGTVGENGIREGARLCLVPEMKSGMEVGTVG